ncbi:S9 family peptidase, partial [filamentous cyanobacterium CCP5]
MPNPALAQDTWQNPPEPIAAFLDAPFLPQAFISPDNQWLFTLEHPPLEPLASLAQPRIQVAGLQINPATYAPALEYGYCSLTVQHIATGQVNTLALPSDARIRNFRWSPSSRYLAFTNTRPEGLELWLLDVPQGTIKRLLPPIPVSYTHL